MAQLGFIPRGGEGFDYGGYRFTVLEMDHRRVSRVKLQKLPPITEPATEEHSAASQLAETAVPQTKAARSERE